MRLPRFARNGKYISIKPELPRATAVAMPPILREALRIAITPGRNRKPHTGITA
jgi:hypothetical protein